MKLPNYIFFEPQGELTGAGFILCSIYPFYISKVIKFKAIAEMEMNIKGIAVNGYTIEIRLIGSLATENNTSVDLVLQGMANYYLNEKILKNEPYYRKYKNG